MRYIIAALAAWTILAGTALAQECRRNPAAPATGRVLKVDPGGHPRIGTMQYAETLPLADREVALTFDDGPRPPYSQHILDTLAAECVKATFFMIGVQARAHPDLVRRAVAEGHTIATHTETHPYRFDLIDNREAEKEIEGGIAAVTDALGETGRVAPFFRFPGLRRTEALEDFLAGRGIMVWSADLVADDWRNIPAAAVVERAVARLARKGRGVLLLHDIQPAAAVALPGLLQTLKARGYKIVPVVPADNRPPAAPVETWRPRLGWRNLR